MFVHFRIGIHTGIGIFIRNNAAAAMDSNSVFVYSKTGGLITNNANITKIFQLTKAVNANCLIFNVIG